MPAAYREPDRQAQRHMVQAYPDAYRKLQSIAQRLAELRQVRKVTIADTLTWVVTLAESASDEDLKRGTF